MKDLIIVCRDFATVFGIPCALVRYCVIPPTIIWTMSCFASMVGRDVAHWSSLSFILSIICDHGCVWSTLFPIQAPRTLVGLPSLAIFISRLSGSSSLCILLESIILFLCVSVPIGMISVFSRLNFAPDALHHVVSSSSRSLYLSDVERYTVVSSVYRLILTVVLEPGMS